MRDPFKYSALDTNADQLSVEAIIKDLGNQKSELNLKILRNVEKRANYKHGLLRNQDDYKGQTDYDQLSTN